MKTDQLTRTIDIKNRAGQVVGQKEVVTYQGLLSKAHDEGLKAVRTSLVQVPSADNGWGAIVKAVVETGKGTFEGIGDANPENVGTFIVPHLIRMAETRAKARALRDAVNVGVISFEELDGEASAESVSDPGLGASEPAQVSRTRRPGVNGPSAPVRKSTARSGNGGLTHRARRERRDE